MLSHRRMFIVLFALVMLLAFTGSSHAVSATMPNFKLKDDGGRIARVGHRVALELRRW
jgi:hypothetical protein